MMGISFGLLDRGRGVFWAMIPWSRVKRFGGGDPTDVLVFRVWSNFWGFIC